MDESLHNLRYLVVGAGFFGAVMAERIAADLGERVLVIDRRQHVGGNSWSADDLETGIECHCYGSHIFHTADADVWEYVQNFSSFNSYRHRVLTSYQGRIFQMPINLATINSFYGRTMSPAEAAMLLSDEACRENTPYPANLEEKAVAQIGRPLYEAFVQGYTAKQWGTDPRMLPADIISRLPVRNSYKSDYFNDPWQGIPLKGYHELFAKILNREKIQVMLGLDFFAIRDRIPADCTIIYTGPIDRYYDYRYGRLGWRTLDFEKEVCATGDYQGTAVVNYADQEIPYTRIHEFRHYHEERPYPSDRTVIFREYSRACGSDDEPFYPVNTRLDKEIMELYRAEADREQQVFFGGRLGSYCYMDMDRSIAAALHTYRTRIRAGRRI